MLIIITETTHLCQLVMLLRTSAFSAKKMVDANSYFNYKVRTILESKDSLIEWLVKISLE